MTAEQRQEWARQMEAENRQLADGLERVAGMIVQYCQVLRGERDDLSGCGEWRMICDQIERIAKVKINPDHT